MLEKDVRVRGACLAAAQTPGMNMPADGVAAPSPWLGVLEKDVRVDGAGLAVAQPPGMNMLADGVAASECLTRGVGERRPGARSWLGGWAAPGYEPVGMP